MPMYNLIEYSDNYSDISASLWQLKRGESRVANARNPDKVSTNNSTLFQGCQNWGGSDLILFHLVNY